MGTVARRVADLGGAIQGPTVTQGYGTGIPQLSYAGAQTFPYIPQAGTIPANAPLYPFEPQQIQQAGFSMQGLLVPALIAGGLVFALRR
jgi:hypothetical protein